MSISNRTAYRNRRCTLQIRTGKMLIDGSSSAPSCSTREPYSHDPSLPQIINWTQEEMNQVFEDAHLAGFQITAHCIGDNAVEK